MAARLGGRRAPWSMKRIAWVAFVVLASLLAVVLIARATIVGALARGNPDVAARFAADDGRVRIAAAMREFRTDKINIGPDTAASAQAALRDVPLADEPFLLGGVSALMARENAAAVAFLEEARRRNPRSRPTRLLLLDRYLQSGRSADAARELAVMIRLLPAASEILVPELAKFARNPDAAPTLRAVLARDEVTRHAVLAHMATNGAPVSTILGLAGAAASRSGRVQAWHNILLDRLLNAGEVTQAYDLWRRFAGVTGEPSPIYDAGFSGQPGPAPFNWTLASSGDGVGEPDGAGGLDVQYYGRKNVVLATQTLVLAPGTYEFSFRASGDTPSGGSAIAWTAKCLGGSRDLFRVAIGETDYSGTLRGGRFTVPQDCTAQRLSLEAQAREFATSETLNISDLSLARQP